MATLKSLSQFKSKLIGGGARPNLFEVSLNVPGAAAGVNLGLQGDGDGQFDAEKFTFLCKAAALPASNISPIEVPFRGRTMKVAGDRTFDTWTITVINDEDFQYRRAFEAWMQNIGQYSDHSGLTSPVDYMADATVLQLGRGTQNGGNSDFTSGRTPGRETGTGTGRGYLAARYEAKNTNRQFLNDFEWEGPAKHYMNKPQSYDDMYNARMNPNKEEISLGREPTQESVKLGAGSDLVNIHHKRIRKLFFPIVGP